MKYSMQELRKMGFKPSIAGYFDVNGLEQDKKEMINIIKAFDGDYFFNSIKLHDRTEYTCFFDERSKEYSVSCSISINNVAMTIANKKHRILSYAVCTVFMNASGFKGEFSANKIQAIVDSMIEHNNNTTSDWEQAEQDDWF